MEMSKVNKKKKRDRTDKIYRNVFATFAFLSVVLVFMITFFIVIEGIKPFIGMGDLGSINFFDFLFGTRWAPQEGVYGIGYMIVGTLLSVTLAIIMAVPVSILTAIAITELLPKKIAEVVQTLVELLAGIPSVIYGVFGLGFLVPIIKDLPFNNYAQGNSLLAVSVVLAIMIIPTIVAVTTTSLQAVPMRHKEASLGLGATQVQTILKVTLPSAKSGVLAAIILGVGRAIGETMAVIMVAGNVSGGFASSIYSPIRPLTANIAMDMSYASGLHKQALFSTALILFIFVFGLNLILQFMIKGGKNAKK